MNYVGIDLHSTNSYIGIIDEKGERVFDKYERFIVFYEWVRVLKLGGKVTIQVPNFKKILSRYFKFGFDNFVDVVFGENLWESKFYIGHFGNHKWGYSEKTLKQFVEKFGIIASSIKASGLNLRLTGIKYWNTPSP